MSSQKSGHGVPHENIDIHPFERIRRWVTKVHRESKTYHDCNTPFKSIENSDDYGAYPPQKVPPKQLLSRRPIKPGMLHKLPVFTSRAHSDISDDSEGPRPVSDPSNYMNPAHDERRQSAPQNFPKHKRSFQEPHDEQLSSKRRRLETSSWGDGVPDRARIRARHRGDLSHSLKESTPRALQVLENTRSHSSIDPDAGGEVKQDRGHAPAKLHKSYERQPRRKTRADKYKPKVLERTSKPHRAKETKRSKQTHSALKFDFKAPNVPQHRLTLKSGAYLGIFAKGKASSPVRRRGLPDLSFPEMNFLASHKDRHVQPLFSGAIRQLSKKKPIQTEQDKIAEYFAKPLMNEDPFNHDKSETHHSLRGPSNCTPYKSALNSKMGRNPTGLFSKMGSISPEKSGTSRGRGVPLSLSNQENAATRSLDRSVRQGPTEHAEEDAFDRSTLYFPWSTSNIPSQRPLCQPLGDVSKNYLTLEDLHQLLRKRQQEDHNDKAEAFEGVNPGNEGEKTSFGTPSPFRSVEYQSMTSRYRQSARPDTEQLPPRQGRVLNYGTPATGRLPDMYAGQLAEPEDFRIFEDIPSEGRVDHRRFVSEGVSRCGTRNENVDTLPDTYAERSSVSPLALWKDSQAQVEENEEETSFFKPSDAKRPTRYSGSSQKTVTFVHGRDYKPRQQYGDLFGGDARRFLMEGVGEPFERRVSGKAHDVGVSALLLAEQEVNAELATKGFWRPRRR